MGNTMKKPPFSMPLLAYIAINLLFIAKYASRIYPAVAIVACVVYAIAIMVLFRWLTGKNKLLNPKSLLVASLFMVGVLIAMQSAINPYEIKVDRWSAIHNFIKALLQGSYPYGAETHLHGYGSPFPVWQVFHIPFYLLGNVGLSFAAATLLFIHSMYRQWGTKAGSLALSLLVCSPAYLYEIAVRSDMMTNFLLSCAILNYLIAYKVTLSAHPVAISVLCGLMASTRLTAVLPFFMLYFGEFIHLPIKGKIIFLLTALATFILTFLPFLLWDANQLLYSDHGPFALQTSQIRKLDMLVFLLVGIILSLHWKANYTKLYAFTAIILCFMVAYTFIFNMATRGDWSQLFQSTYDITYFNMSLVFFIAKLASSKDSIETS